MKRTFDIWTKYENDNMKVWKKESTDEKKTTKYEKKNKIRTENMKGKYEVTSIRESMKRKYEITRYPLNCLTATTILYLLPYYFPQRCCRNQASESSSRSKKDDWFLLPTNTSCTPDLPSATTFWWPPHTLVHFLLKHFPPAWKKGLNVYFLLTYPRQLINPFARWWIFSGNYEIAPRPSFLYLLLLVVFSLVWCFIFYCSTENV